MISRVLLIAKKFANVGLLERSIMGKLGKHKNYKNQEQRYQQVPRNMIQ